jgi:hypothetical protein
MDWTNESDVLQQIHGQFMMTFAELIRGTVDLEDFVNGYVSGRYKLILDRDGLLVITPETTEAL